MIKSNKDKKEHYLIRQDNTIYKCSIKFSFPNILEKDIFIKNVYIVLYLKKIILTLFVSM